MKQVSLNIFQPAEFLVLVGGTIPPMLVKYIPARIYIDIGWNVLWDTVQP